LAVAASSEKDAPIARKPTLPPATILRAVVAMTTSSINANDIAAPTAAEAPAASPDDFVVVLDCWTADSMTEPLVASAAPEPSCAVVVLVMSDSASEGVIEMPPAEPALAVAELAYVPDAVKETSPAPDSPLPFSSAADVRLATMFIAT